MPGELRFRDSGPAGSENVLLLLHAFPLHSGMWRPQFESPPDGWRIIAPDFPGFGESPPAAGPAMSMEAAADRVALLLNKLGIPQAVVCGLSMGGYVSFALLRRYPALFRGLVLCDTRAAPDTEEVRRGRLQSAAKALGSGTAELVDGMLGRMLSPNTHGLAPELVAEIRSMMMAAPAESVAAALRGMAERPDSTPLLPSIAVPAHVIAGSDDEITPATEVQQMASAIPGASLTVISEAGHLPNLERPEDFNRALGSFLESLT